MPEIQWIIHYRDAGDISTAPTLPRLPEIKVCLLRRHDSVGDKLVDLVEDMLKQLVLPPVTVDKQ